MNWILKSALSFLVAVAIVAFATSRSAHAQPTTCDYAGTCYMAVSTVAGGLTIQSIANDGGVAVEGQSAPSGATMLAGLVGCVSSSRFVIAVDQSAPESGGPASAFWVAPLLMK